MYRVSLNSGTRFSRHTVRFILFKISKKNALVEEMWPQNALETEIANSVRTLWQTGFVSSSTSFIVRRNMICIYDDVQRIVLHLL